MDGAFNGCTSLTSAVIPDGVLSIGNQAFLNCSSLNSVVMSDGIVSLGDSAFYGCASLTNVIIPSGVTSISNSAFQGCVNLTSVTMHKGVTSIGNNAFADCASLVVVDMPTDIAFIMDGAFSGCTSLTSAVIPGGVLSISNQAFLNCSSLNSVVMSDGIVSIGDQAFLHCSGLTSVTIPRSVTNIGIHAFWGCSSLMSIIVDVDNTTYSSHDGMLYNKLQGSLIQSSHDLTNPSSESVDLGYSGCVDGIHVTEESLNFHICSVERQKQPFVGYDYDWSDHRYFKSDLYKLRLKFCGAENIERNWSQSYQDIFTLSLLDGKKNGSYLEIGGGEGRWINNTYLLEQEFQWTGLAIEYDEGSSNPPYGWKGYIANRKNPCLCEDATKVDYGKILKEYEFKTQIDFLQVDIEPAQHTLNALKAIPHDLYRFSVICFETEIYDIRNILIQKEQFNLLSSLGYKLVAKNVSNNCFPYEDWWVDPSIIDPERLKQYIGHNFDNNLTIECSDIIFSDI